MSGEHELRMRISELETEVSRLKARLRKWSPDVRSLLAHRGFQVFRSAATEKNLLLPPDPRYRGPYLRWFSRYSFRLFLRDVIRHGEAVPEGRTTRFVTSDVYDRYLNDLKRWGLIRCSSAGCALESQVRSLGPTLEWWVGHILKNRMGFSCLRQVFFRRLPVGGDFDLIASVEGRITYIEVKSSPPKQIFQKEISAFLDRMNLLGPVLTVFLIDTELRMKDKLVPMLETGLQRIGTAKPELQRLESELFHHEHRLYLVNAKGGIEENLRRVVADHLHARPGHL